MSLPLKIALRFLFRAHREKELSLFTWVAIFGITLSVLLFFVIDALLNGFSGQVKEILIGFEAPLTLETSFSQKEIVEKNLDHFSQNHPLGKNLKFYFAYEFYGLLGADEEHFLGMKARIIDEQFFLLKKHQGQIYWQEGFDEAAFIASRDAILIGEELYKNLPYEDVAQGRVRVVNPFADLSPGGELIPQSQSFEIAGILSTGYYEIDQLYVFLPQKSLEGFDPHFLGLNFFLYPENFQGTEKVKTALLENFKDLSSSGLQTWLEKNKNLFRAMSLEKLVFLVLLFLIVMISIVNLSSVIRIYLLNKKSALAILSSLGLAFSEIRKISLWIGCLLGTLGTFFGILFGSLLLFCVAHMGSFLPEAYGFTEIPWRLKWQTVVLIIFLTPILAMAVSYFPTRDFGKRALVQEF